MTDLSTSLNCSLSFLHTAMYIPDNEHPAGAVHTFMHWLKYYVPQRPYLSQQEIQFLEEELIPKMEEFIQLHDNIHDEQDCRQLEEEAALLASN